MSSFFRIVGKRQFPVQAIPYEVQPPAWFTFLGTPEFLSLNRNQRGCEGDVVTGLRENPRANTRVSPVFDVCVGTEANAGSHHFVKLSRAQSTHEDLGDRRPHGGCDSDAGPIGIARFVRARLVPREGPENHRVFPGVMKQNPRLERRDKVILFSLRIEQPRDAQSVRLCFPPRCVLQFGRQWLTSSNDI